MSVRNHTSDTLRSIAALLVVMIHLPANDITINDPEVISWAKNVIDSFSRIAVPLFVLISGRYLLGKTESPKVFYTRRAARLLPPLIFWSVFYLLLYLGRSYAFEGVLPLKQAALNLIEGSPYYHMWYLFMLVGLYAAAPLLNEVIGRTSRRGLIRLAIGLTLLGWIDMNYNTFYGNKSFWGVWFFDYLGYFLWGYLLKGSKKTSIGWLLAVYCLCSLAAGTLTDWATGGVLEGYFRNYLSPLVILGALAIYKLFDQLDLPVNMLSRMAPYAFGIYLIHPAVIAVLRRVPVLAIENPIVGIPLNFVVVVALSGSCSFLMTRIKGLKRLV